MACLPLDFTFYSFSHGLFNYVIIRLVGIAAGYGLDDRGVGVRVPVGSRIFSSPRCLDRLWGPPSLLSNGYWGLFPQGTVLFKITVARSSNLVQWYPHVNVTTAFVEQERLLLGN
jgi:hypothetical protein